jgi:hypothetical protein
VAARLGMSIDECLRKHTRRQMLVWSAHFDEVPGAEEHLLAQLCDMFLRANSKKGRRSKGPDAFRQRFGAPAAPRQTVEQAAAASKARWAARLGRKVSDIEGG